MPFVFASYLPNIRACNRSTSEKRFGNVQGSIQIDNDSGIGSGCVLADHNHGTADFDPACGTNRRR